jgi:hypothetical protein
MSDPVLPHASPPRGRRLGPYHKGFPGSGLFILIQLPRGPEVFPVRRKRTARRPSNLGDGPVSLADGCTSVRPLILFDDIRRDAPALVDLLATRLRPSADVRAALTTGGGTAAAATARTGLPRVLHVL